MKFISNVRGCDDPKNGTIFSAEIDGMTISVHKLMLTDGWFLSCNLLGISCQKILKERVDRLQKTVDAFSKESVEISKY